MATGRPRSSAAVATRNATVTRSASSWPVARLTTTLPAPLAIFTPSAKMGDWSPTIVLGDHARQRAGQAEHAQGAAGRRGPGVCRAGLPPDPDRRRVRAGRGSEGHDLQLLHFQGRAAARARPRG